MTKIDIFSGFLGAGKTTLIKKLIADGYQGEKVVLIENEFGEIAVDGGFLKDAGIEITEMNSGCICCSLVGDFREALHKVIDEFHPDRILIEPSGVGKLSDVIHAVQSVASDEVVLNGFTTVVDATKAKMYMKNFGEFFNNQIENAACIILSRTDSIKEDKLDAAIALIREKNPEAVIITTPWDQLAGKTILEAIERKSTLKDTLAGMVSEAEDDDVCPVCGGHHDHEHEHDHDHDHEHHHHDHDEDEEHEHHHHHDHDDDDDDDHDHCGCGHDHHHDHDHHHHHHGHDADEVFVSWGAETYKKYSEEDIRSALDAFADSEKYGMVLRAKGFVPASDGGEWVYFDYTPGEVNVRRGAADVTGRICVIGSKIKEENLKELFRVG
ncbi:MAG: GTP-binding protein [Oscillospiraceae bacterium]|nr:GTP-binding protein [Oscillospiraceae bacterium]